MRSGGPGLFKGLCLIVGLLFLAPATHPARAGEAPITSFGSGKVQVRLYTDYFCGPCGRMEPKVEGLISDLVRKNIITLTLVDTPVHTFTPLYAKCFLYVLRKDRNFSYAIRARELLFQAARDRIEEKEALEEFLRKNRVQFQEFDAAPALAALNAMIREDNVSLDPHVHNHKRWQARRFYGRHRYPQGPRASRLTDTLVLVGAFA